MTLFPTLSKQPSPRVHDPRQGLRIPTGSPRLVESSRDRDTRAIAAAWQALLDGVRQSSAARIDLLKGRSGSERLSCGWKRLSGCDADCRCRGAGTVTVDFLRSHYARLAIELALLAQPDRRGS